MSFASTVALRACCVCGKATSTRCSACAKVGIDLFFCSPEHQKLVWKGAHSKVCGQKGHPFDYPDMTAIEAQAVKRSGRIDPFQGLDAQERRVVQEELCQRFKLSVAPGFSQTTLANTLCDLARIPESDFEKVIPGLLQDSRSGAVGDRALFLRTAYSALFGFHLCRDYVSPVSFPYSPFCPVAHLEAHIDAKYPEISGTRAVTQLLHHALVLYQLINIKKQASPPTAFQPSFAIQAFRKLAFGCSDILPFRSPEETADTIQALLRSVQPELHFKADWAVSALSFKIRHLEIYPCHDHVTT
ncbi:hypothetical protein JCM8097_007991 [Rhodosporidiobolus ruineniae]